MPLETHSAVILLFFHCLYLSFVVNRPFKLVAILPIMECRNI